MLEESCNATEAKGEIETSSVEAGILGVIGIPFCPRKPASDYVVENGCETGSAEWVWRSMKRSSLFPQGTLDGRIPRSGALRAPVTPTPSLSYATQCETPQWSLARDDRV
jgi:hypothetical protein